MKSDANEQSDAVDLNPSASGDDAPNDRRSIDPGSQEMREYHDQRPYVLVRVGSTWMFGSGN